MDVSEFVTRWSDWFPQSPPLRQSLRRAFRQRWLRIYSLPNGKRYASTVDEKKELLRRHNATATTLLGEGQEVAVVLAYLNGYRGEREPAPARRLEATVLAAPTEQWDLDDEAVLDAEDAVFAVAFTVWMPQKFDELITAVGNEEVAPLLFVNIASGSVYSPYDGGADLFPATKEHLVELRGVLAEWLSPRADGL